MFTLLFWLTITAVGAGLSGFLITFVNWRDDRKSGSRSFRAKRARQFQLGTYFFLASFVWPLIILWGLYRSFMPTVTWVKKIRYQFKADLNGVS